jgi:poly-gamma-glutamate capsule biosynthesis protein CapA/YwtB (metallophosphatase superfamily)
MSPSAPLVRNSIGPLAQGAETVTLFLAGDVMTGRGVDQVLPNPADPQIYESYAKSAQDYVCLAERANGPIARPVSFNYIWGDALAELDRKRPDARIINLETAVTTSASPAPKGINYKMSPANIGAITAAGVDCCVLANNHVLDWGPLGLLEGLTALEQAGVHYAGAGRDDVAAAAPAILTQEKGRVLVFAFASPSSGVPLSWAAAVETPGINIVSRFSPQTADRISEQVRAIARAGDIVVASIHWGINWGYEITHEQTEFAHRLVEACDVDIVHGHSSHHVKGIEVHHGKLILYGCGDFIDDYEGITGYEEFRDDLVLMYFPTLRINDGALVSLEMVPLQIRNMRLQRASRMDAEWLAGTLERESRAVGTHIRLGADDVLRLAWQ